MQGTEIIRGVHNIAPRHRGCVATIGNFDGVHVGHKMMLDTLIARAREHDLPSVLVTFEPLPLEFFERESVLPRLTRFREKITLLKQTQLDRVLCIPFNEQTAATPAEDVVRDFLVDGLGVRWLVVGDDFRFGAGASGDYELLTSLGAALDFGVTRMPTCEIDGGRVSSTRIRGVLAAGDFDAAQRLLGYPYFIMGRVVYGRQLGRQLGVPTANIRLQRYRAALEGVYAVQVEGEGLSRRFDGIANIGVRPTVDGKEPQLEVNLFDYSGDLYGRLLTVTFCHKLRDERKFDGLPELKAQIELDIGAARAWFEGRG
ncbi:MAG: bifunctional riboflavin kinase/FAD synthetase [Pseudomonadota bacterium]